MSEKNCKVFIFKHIDFFMWHLYSHSSVQMTHIPPITHFHTYKLVISLNISWYKVNMRKKIKFMATVHAVNSIRPIKYGPLKSYNVIMGEMFYARPLP